MPFSAMLLALLSAALMGGNFVASKFALAQFGGFYFNAIRFAIVALLLLPWLIKARPHIKRLLPLSILFGLNFSLGTSALAAGLDIPTTIILLQLSVPVSCLLGVLRHGDRLGPWRVSGMVIAFLGLGLVAGAPSASEHVLGFILAFAGGVIGGFFNVGVKQSDLETYPFMALMSLLCVPQLLLVSFAFETGHAEPFLNPVPTVWAGVAYTVLLNTLIAQSLWCWLLVKYKVSDVAPFSLLAPVFGISFGQLFFAAELPAATIIGGTLTLVGVAIIVIRRPKATVPGQ